MAVLYGGQYLGTPHCNKFSSIRGELGVAHDGKRDFDAAEVLPSGLAAWSRM
jgi:hypothetical protein